ncbi:MAG: hypothetical protein AAB456_00590 [Patescibacteria group bacterium]
MTKKDKIDFINKVNDKFTNARNHGHNGNNWWYPKPNVIAYNVKMHGASKNIDDIRKFMTERQNEYYNDDALYEICNENQNDTARMFSDDIDETHGVKSGYAGRSGGWLEVEYSNPLPDSLYDTTSKDINYIYQEAKKLDTLETKISQEITAGHERLQKYMNTDEYCKDVSDSLPDDDMIADEYKGRAKGLLDKLK